MIEYFKGLAKEKNFSPHNFTISDTVFLCVQVERPDTPTLLAIQASAGTSLAKVVERYLVESGEIKDSVGSLMSDDNRHKVSHKVS